MEGLREHFRKEPGAFANGTSGMAQAWRLECQDSHAAWPGAEAEPGPLTH